MAEREIALYGMNEEVSCSAFLALRSNNCISITSTGEMPLIHHNRSMILCHVALFNRTFMQSTLITYPMMGTTSERKSSGMITMVTNPMASHARGRRSLRRAQLLLREWWIRFAMSSCVLISFFSYICWSQGPQTTKGTHIFVVWSHWRRWVCLHR